MVSSRRTFSAFSLFVSLPILASLVFSFTEYNVLKPPKWVGLRNYKDILGFHLEDVPVTTDVAVPETGETVKVPVYDTVTDAQGATAKVPRTVRRLRANDPNFWYYCYNTLFLMMGLPSAWPRPCSWPSS